MTESMRRHLPVIVVVTIVGIATCAVVLMRVLGAADNLSADTFSTIVFVVPCAVMLVGTFAIAATASRIERQLYVVCMAICLVMGIVAMVVTSRWLSDPTLAASLLANSPGDASITPDTKSPVLMLRDVAAYVVMPTVGCIAGAWVGSRIHPMTADRRSSRRKKGR